MKVTSFGEVLWDDLPNGKVLGGAPLNVLVRLRSFGVNGTIISRRGDDEDGEELQRQITEKKVDHSLLQVDNKVKTSLVKVTLDDKGSATYDIVYPCAWDRIELQESAIKSVKESDAFIFGSLSTRDEISRSTLSELIKHAKFKIFDVNLRPPHYADDAILEMMKSADLVKLNDDELYELSQNFGSKFFSIKQNIEFLANLCNIKKICVTLGSHGAVYYDDGNFYQHFGFRVNVINTVGSGDSFLAGLTYKLLTNTEPQEAITFACAMGALVASYNGATPVISQEEIEALINPK